MQRQTVKTYVDGMGRQLQTVAATPTEKDIIQPFEYGNLGRQVKGYMAYGGNTGDTVGSYHADAPWFIK